MALERMERRARDSRIEAERWAMEMAAGRDPEPWPDRPAPSPSGDPAADFLRLFGRRG